MEDTRKGFLTPDQEKITDKLVELKGVAEVADGPAISLVDNQGAERLKPKLVAKWGPEILPDIYEVIDAIYVPLQVLTELPADAK